MQTINEQPQVIQQQQDDEIDLKRLFYLLIRRWYWLLVFTILGASAAYLYSRFSHQKYQIDTTIVVPEKNKGLDLEDMFKKDLTGTNNVTINNEIELLKSYTLNHQVMENLNWRTEWYQKKLLIWNGLYTEEPFIVQEKETGMNAEGIEINITPQDDKTYTISVDGTALVNEKPTNISFESRGTYGQPFENEYFHFTLHPKEDANTLVGNEYRFIFRNSNILTFQYLKKVNIALTDKNSEVIRLSIEGVEPLREVHYLNELVRVYLDLKLTQQTETQKRSLNFIDEQLSGISDSLSVAETNFSEFRSKNQIIDVSSQGEMVMEQLTDIEKQRSQSQMQLDYFENLLGYLEKGKSIKQLSSPSVVGIEDPSLNSLVMKLSDLYSRREVLAFSAHEDNPTLVLLNKEIVQINQQLRENLINLIDNARVTIKTLNKRYDKISSQLNNLPGKEQQLINIKRQYELTNDIYTFLLQRRAEIEITLASTVVDVQIIDPARMERIVQTSTSSIILIILGVLLGLAFPISIILLSDLFNTKIHLQEDVEKLTSLNIIGNVLHSRAKSETIVIDDPTAPISESYRTIRTNLQYKFTLPGEKVIGIHSISPGEGKTFSVTNLGSILAMNDKRTLLIGADLRKPRLHQIFNLSNDNGLSNYLIGQSEAKDIVLESMIDNLFIIVSGPVPPNPAELLERPRMNELLEWAKKEFDYIIFDNAPVSMVTDGLITSRLSDLNLFILRYHVSRKNQLKFINEIANQGVMKNPALIINDIKLHGGYGYNYSYKYAYSRGYSYKEKEKGKRG